MKKLGLGLLTVIAVAVLLAVAVQLSHEETAASAAQLQGDVTCEGAVDSIDALRILGSVAGLPGTANCLAAAGDVDCSGVADSLDSLRILRHLAKLGNAAVAGCAEIGEPLTVPPNSYDLINAALGQGEITDEEALVYKLYASFADPRLPAQYKGEDADLHDGLIVAQALARFSSLSLETQALVQPFLLLPGEPGNALGLDFPAAAGQAVGVQATSPNNVPLLPVEGSSNVLLHYRQDRPQDLAVAEGLRNTIDAVIWPQLTSLMGQPKSDLGLGNPQGNGADGRIDIVLTGQDVRSYAQPLGGCQQASGVIFLGIAGATPETATHELMHVMQFRFPVSDQCQWPEYVWIHEGISQWSQDFVYPGPPHTERGSTGLLPKKCFLAVPGLPLEFQNDCHEYGSYLFFQYLSKSYSPTYIRQVWDNSAGDDSLGAINAVVASAGGFREVWPDFALAEYNVDPSKRFQQWDAFFDRVGLETDEDVSLGGAPSKEYTVRGDVEHMGALFHSFTFEDSNIRRVVFTHPFADGSQPTARVMAVIKLAGQSWKVEDWTADARKSFCYEDGDPEVEQLIIIISNSEYQDRNHVLDVPEQPKLKVHNACAAEGTITYSRSQHGAYENGRGNNVTVDMTDNATIEFDMEADEFSEGAFAAITSSISWNFSRTVTEHFPATEDSPACDSPSTANGSGSWQAMGGPTLTLGLETTDGTLFGTVINPDAHLLLALSPENNLPEGDPSSYYHAVTDDFCGFLILEFDLPYAVVALGSAMNPEDGKNFSGSFERTQPSLNTLEPPITEKLTWSITLR